MCWKAVSVEERKSRSDITAQLIDATHWQSCFLGAV